MTAIPRRRPAPPPPVVPPLLALVEQALDDGKAEAIVTIGLAGKTDIADHMIVASGRSQRQVVALADRVVEAVKAAGVRASVEGLRHGDWVLIDAGDVIVHLFKPEARAYYNLEKMWGDDLAVAALAAP